MNLARTMMPAAALTRGATFVAQVSAQLSHEHYHIDPVAVASGAAQLPAAAIKSSSARAVPR